MAKLYLILALFLVPGRSFASQDTFRIHSDLPVINTDENLALTIFYSSDFTFKGDLQIQFFKYEKNDSVLILDYRHAEVSFKKGVNRVTVCFTRDDTGTYYNQKFYEVLKRANTIAPGTYKMLIAVKRKGEAFNMNYAHEIDSLLSPGSPVRHDINKSLLRKSPSFLGIRLKNPAKNATANAGTALFHGKIKTDKAIKRRGLQSLHSERNRNAIIDIYYQDWFVGRYEAKSKSSLGPQIEKQDNIVSTPDFNSITSNKLNSPSLFSQYKGLNKEKKDQEEIKGEIALNTNVATGQEQNSDIDNNYYEIRGTVDMPILGIPVTVEGLYTSQDNSRKIKSSYFRVHYNADKVKDDLSMSIRSYNAKFAETKSKNLGVEQIYKSSLSNLEKQKATLQNEINVDSKNIAADDLVDGDLNASGVANSVDENGDATKSNTKDKVKKNKDAALEKKKRIESKRQQLLEVTRKIEKYQQLLAQYKNTNFFDSSLGYAKTQNMHNYEDLSYKQMAKKGANLLPDGKAKTALAGLTSMDAGMFSKYESKYTMSGQMMKGLDVGYDLSFTEVGATVGKTEYVGRDGSLDKYTCYSGRAVFKPLKEQKVSLIYYGYTADKKMYQGDGFFNKVNISAPGFFEPVHIASINYVGGVSKYVSADADIAMSFKNSEKENDPQARPSDKTAYHLNLEGVIPNTPVGIETGYDKTGKSFENNTLPIILKGTEQYRIAARTDLFRALITLGVNFNRLRQDNFATSSNSTKWGFDVKTNSKRYPNLALSYKPFTTFHSYTDTLNIPQRPLLGSVWTGKATYQIKRHSQSLRFLMLYNYSMTTMDTIQTGSKLIQASGIYSDKLMSGSATVGYMQLTGATQINQTTPNNSTFISLAITYALNKRFSISGGQDFGFAHFGFCRYAATGGFAFRPSKVSLIILSNIRLNTYQLSESESWKQLYSGNIELIYRFKTKMKNDR